MHDVFSGCLTCFFVPMPGSEVPLSKANMNGQSTSLLLVKLVVSGGAPVSSYTKTTGDCF